jgi:murein DD-endopeptidase MepM/ murein hydrolase activator NlpD
MSKRRFSGLLPLALIAAFVAGAVVDGWLRTYGPPKPSTRSDLELRPMPPAATISRSNGGPTPSAAAPTAAATTTTRIGAAPTPVATAGDVPQGRLRVPIDGESIESLKGGFAETRGSDRPHEAVDMLAPRNTPVHAVDNGTIAKLFTSKAGGLTIYQFDPSGHLCYYYAHLERYADGLKDGQAVSQGDVIGYVGTTGNAPANTPHLHFAVFELKADKRWWEGKAIDPYQVFKSRG